MLQPGNPNESALDSFPIMAACLSCDNCVQPVIPKTVMRFLASFCYTFAARSIHTCRVAQNRADWIL